jgi:hypothetical protein
MCHLPLRIFRLILSFPFRVGEHPRVYVGLLVADHAALLEVARPFACGAPAGQRERRYREHFRQLIGGEHVTPHASPLGLREGPEHRARIATILGLTNISLYVRR